MPHSHRGNTVALTIIGSVTSYGWATALPDKEMGTVARALLKVMTMFGPPKVLQSDNGSEFVNQLVKSLCSKFGVQHRLTSAYHPRANGRVERLNDQIETIFSQADGRRNPNLGR